MAATPSVCIVLDGANVSTRNDGQRLIPRLAAALAFFRELQQTRQCVVRCIAFVPNFWLHTKPTDACSGNGSMETDDWELLQSLVDQELVVLTPSHAHDDFYVIDYAIKNDGFVVTNDMFRDHIEHKRIFQGRQLSRNWTRKRCIDFTFVGNEFLPNSQAIEKALVHVPRPNSPRDTIPATTATTTTTAKAPIAKTATTTAKATTAKTTTTTTRESVGAIDASSRSQPTAPKPQQRRLSRSSSLTKSIPKSGKNDQEDSEDDDDDDRPDIGAAGHMAVDHVRKKNVDLSELTPYRVPRYLLPLLHGDDGQTMGRFMDHTSTYIVAPALNTSATSDVATLSIYGAEPNRMHAVKILDAALPELHQQYQFQLHQQQQWLLAQQQHQQLQQQQFQYSTDLQQQHHQQFLQQQYLQQHQHQHHPPANYPLQHHAYGDDRMDIE